MNIHDCLNLSSCGVVITGGAGHMGRAFAKSFTELGANVVIADIDSSEINNTVDDIKENFKNASISGIACDLSDRSNLDSITKQFKSAMSRIDVLINNAAFVGSSELSGWISDFENQSIETFSSALNLNLIVPFALSQKLYPDLRKNGTGTIINIGSMYGVVGPDMSLYEGISNMGNPAAYSASKGGLLQLTRWLSTVLAPDVRVNMISPGGIKRGQKKRFVNRYNKRTPLGRMGIEKDLVGAAIFFASELSSYITGQNLIVDGGYTVW